MRNNFDAARLLFAVAVIFSHSFALAGQQEWTVYGRSIGAMAVHGFFVISGYLISKSYVSTNSLASFAWKRTLRIAPALIVALVISHLLWVQFDHFSANPVPYIVNGPVWTLTWEVVCYGACAALGLIGLLAPGTLAPFAAAAWLAFILASGDRSSTANTVVAPLFMMFLGGAIIAIYEKKIDFRKAFPVACALVILTCIPAIFSALFEFVGQLPFLFGPKVSEIQVRDLIYTAAAPIVVIIACQYTRPIRVRVDLSYGLYLYGWPVAQVIVASAAKIGFQISPMRLLAMTLPVAAALACVSWFIIERPVLLLKGRSGDTGTRSAN